MKKVLFVAVLLVAAGSAGYLAGRADSTDPPHDDSAPVRPDGADDVGERSPRLQACIDRLRAVRPRDIESCWSELRDLGDPSSQSHRLDEIIALDPLAAIALSKAAGETRVLKAIMRHWARKDPVAAFGASDQLPTFTDLFEIRGGLANAALADAIQREDAALLIEVLATAVTFHGGPSFGIFLGETEIKPGERRKMLDALAEVDSHHSQFAGIFARFAKEDYDAARAWLEARPELLVGRPELQRSLIHAGFEHDFESALARMIELVERHPSEMRAMEGLACSAARKDPHKAISLLEKLVAHPDDSMRRHLIDSYLRQTPDDQRETVRAEIERRGLVPEPRPPRWPPKDLDTLHALLEADALGSMRVDYHGRPPFGVVSAAAAIAEADPAHVPKKVVEVTAWQWGATDPEAAIRWAAGLDESLALPGARSALRHWATADLEAAEGYALGLPESAFQAAAAGVIVSQREELDREAARRWVESQESGSFRDAAAAHFVRRSSDDELEMDLLPLAIEIGDEALRRESLLELLDNEVEIIDAPGVAEADREFLRRAQL